MIGYFRTVLKAVACDESHFHGSWHLEYPSVVLFPQQHATTLFHVVLFPATCNKTLSI